MTLTEDQVQSAEETAKAEVRAARLAAVCPDAADEIAAAERKAAEVVAKAQAKREAKDGAIRRLIDLTIIRARTLSYAAEIREPATVDLNALGVRAAQSLMDSKRSPCTQSQTLYESLANDLTRLTVLQPFLQGLLKTVEADCAAQLESIRIEAKKEGISLPVLLDLLKRESGLNDLKNANQNPEVLGLFSNGHFADIA